MILTLNSLYIFSCFEDKGVILRLDSSKNHYKMIHPHSFWLAPGYADDSLTWPQILLCFTNYNWNSIYRIDIRKSST